MSVMKASSNTQQAQGPIGPSRFARLSPLSAGSVRLDPLGFLGNWQIRNARATIQHCITNLESSGVLHNFRRVADGEEGPFRGMWFADTDLYKTLEAIGWESARVGTPVHTEFVDQAIALIGRTQREDGYLNTFVQGDKTKTCWTSLVTSHELYCAGHLFQAAVALSRGANDDRLLQIAQRFAELILTDLGDRDDGFDGHAEVETALVELFRLTADERYLDFARTQIQRRGHHLLPVDNFGREYYGDHEPVETIDEAIGHAVRQIYFATGVIDVYLEQGDPVLLEAATRLWASAFGTKTYITGGHGSRHHGEAFGDAFELPPDRAYAETCAGIASFQWNWRMLLATGESRYAAAMENVLYNTIAASVALDGQHFFYTNPLQLRTDHRGGTENSPSQRLSWFECACCPPNLARLIASLAEYTMTASKEGLQLHHLTPLILHTQHEGIPVQLEVSTDYPWDGAVEIRVDTDAEFELAIRIPTSTGSAIAILDGVEYLPDADGFVRINKAWTGRSVIYLSLSLRPEIITPHPNIDAVRGTVAIRRGPFVYCIETADQSVNSKVEHLRISQTAVLEEIPSSAPGVNVALRTKGTEILPGHDLYHSAGEKIQSRPATITAIPYFAWGNRGQTAMRVWIPTS